MATKTGSKGNRKPDWVAIRAEYEAGGISQRDLAAKHNVPYPTLRDRSKREGWAASRDEIRSEVIAKTSQRIVEQKVDEISQLMTDQVEDLKKLWGMAVSQATKLVEVDKTKQVPVGFQIEDLELTSIDRLAGLKMAGQALKDFQFGMRRALGLEGKQNAAPQTNEEPLEKLAAAIDLSAVPDLSVQTDDLPGDDDGV